MASISPLEVADNSRKIYGSQLDRCVRDIDMKVSSAQKSPLVSAPEEICGAYFYPQTPTLLAPDTPTTAGPTSPGPATPNTPSFLPPSPGYAYTKNDDSLNVAAAPCKVHLLLASRFGTQRVGASQDMHDVGEEEEGQEILIPEPPTQRLPPLRLHLSPPRLSTSSTDKLKARQSYPVPTSAYTIEELHLKHFNSRASEVADAYKPNALSPSTTTAGDSFETGMFEMLTSTQDGGAFDRLEPSLAERTFSILCPLPADTSTHQPHASSVNGSRPTSTVSDNPSSNASDRPLILRRHRPPPTSISQDLSSLIRRFHALHDFLRRHDDQPTTVSSGDFVYETPPRSAGAPRRFDNAAVLEPELRARRGDLHMTPSPDAASFLAPTAMGLWFPPSGSDSPVRFFADSPVPLTSIPPSPEVFLRRHHPPSVRSISPMRLDESPSANSGLQGLHNEVEQAYELLFPLPPTRHRRQRVVSVSCQALEDFDGDFGSTSSRSLSPRERHHIEGPQTEYSRRDRLPEGTARPEVVAPNLSPELGMTQGAYDIKAMPFERPKKPKGFWKAVGTSASGLFTRRDKKPSKKIANFEDFAPKKRVISSLSGLFRRRGAMASLRPSEACKATPQEVWPPQHRRTSSCSDPTCFFHPQLMTSSLVAMSFADVSSSRFECDLGDDGAMFLPDLSNWGPEPGPNPWEFDHSRSESLRVTSEETNVRMEGEKMLRDILNVSGGGESV